MKRIVLLGVLLLWTADVVPTAANEPIMRIPVTFEVDNVNGTLVSCRPDGLRYRIKGEIVGPASLLAQRTVPVGTLYLHELSFGRFYWTFGDVPGYDYAEALARRGHVSIVVDRLGYDASGHPPGNATCLGAQADIAAQIVRKLKAGTGTPRFEDIVLAGHSVGGGVAELAAHTFADLDLAGLVLFAWADRGYTARSIEQSLQQARDCIPTGEPAYPGGPSGYAYFGRTEADFQANVFKDTDPAVATRATALRNRDPCGDNATLARILVVNTAGASKITAPVLLVFGDEDAIYEDGAAQDQADLFTGSTEVTLRRIAGAGHALALERSAPTLHDITADWLPPPEAAGPHAETAVTTVVDAAPEVEGAMLPATGAALDLVALGFLLVASGLCLVHFRPRTGGADMHET